MDSIKADTITYKNLNADDFLKYVIIDSTLFQEFKEFNINTRKRKSHKAKSKFKKHAIKRLANLYNQFENEKLLSQPFFENYFKFKKYKGSVKSVLDTIQKKIEDNKSFVNKNRTLLVSVKTNYSNLKKSIDPVIFKRKTLYNSIRDDEYEIYEFKFKLRDKKITSNEEKNLKKSIDTLNQKINHTLVEIRKLENDNRIELEKFYDYEFTYDFTIDSISTIITTKNKEKDSLINEIPQKNTSIKNIQNTIDDLISLNRIYIKKVPLWVFKVNNIEIDFNDGFIEHITVIGEVDSPALGESIVREFLLKKFKDSLFKNPTDLNRLLKEFYKERIVKEILADVLDKELKFINEYPIGFSSKTDFADLSKYTLYSFKGNEKTFSIPLDEVISLYVQKHQNDRLDFSPKDQVVRLPLDDVNKNNQIELKKESSSKILNANIFTDFNGLKESEPNGLVQIEIEKQIPLWTRRMELGIGRSSNIGFFNYAKFNLTWAKLAEEDRELQVSYAESFVNNETQVDKYVTYLDLIRYESTSVGIDINIASIDFPLIKTRFELNAGAHFGRVNVVDDVFENTNDTIPKRVLDKKMNMIRLYPDVIVRFRPDERFGVYLRFRPFRVIVPDNEEFFSVSSAKNFEENRKLTKDWLHRFELGSFFTPSADSDNKFFFRYRYTNTSRWETNGYSEFQVGYSMYLKF